VFDKWAIRTIFDKTHLCDNFEFFDQVLRQLEPRDLQETLLSWLKGGENTEITEPFADEYLKHSVLIRLLTSTDVRELWCWRKEIGLEKGSLKEFMIIILNASEESFNLLLEDAAECNDFNFSNMAYRARIILNTRTADMAIYNALNDIQAERNILKLTEHSELNLPIPQSYKQQMQAFRHKHR
jgi:hypothetical protein